jgi:hypothetical protein
MDPAPAAARQGSGLAWGFAGWPIGPACRHGYLPVPQAGPCAFLRGACLGLRVGVHQRGGQPWQRVQQVVLGADRDLVCLHRTGSGVDDDLAFGVPDPAQPDLAHAQYPRRGAQRLLSLIDQGRVHGVYQLPAIVGYDL